MILFINVHIKEAHKQRNSPISDYANAELNSKFNFAQQQKTINTGLEILEILGSKLQTTPAMVS